MDALALVNLNPVMALTKGRTDVIVGLIDGPVDTSHPDLAVKNIRNYMANNSTSCSNPNSIACNHGTLVAGVLSAKRESDAPAICPDCSLLVRPIFRELSQVNDLLPTTTFKEIANAILDCVEAGAHVINISAAPVEPSISTVNEIRGALDFAAKHGVLVVAAAGNQSTLGASAITRHPWVIPVSASDEYGHPLAQSNYGLSIGQLGLLAPGASITSLAAAGKLATIGGTSIAAPFVTGTIALLFSLYPNISSTVVRTSLVQPSLSRRKSIVPPLLNATSALEYIKLRMVRAI